MWHQLPTIVSASFVVITDRSSESVLQCTVCHVIFCRGRQQDNQRHEVEMSTRGVSPFRPSDVGLHVIRNVRHGTVRQTDRQTDRQRSSLHNAYALCGRRHNNFTTINKLLTQQNINYLMAGLFINLTRRKNVATNNNETNFIMLSITVAKKTDMSASRHAAQGWLLADLNVLPQLADHTAC